MTNKIPFSDYREIITVLNSEKDVQNKWFDLFNNDNWYLKYFITWRNSQPPVFRQTPYFIVKREGLRFFVKLVLNKYKNTEL